MTRDEHRAKCVEAMEEAFYKRSSGEPTSVYNCMSAAFDSLHGIAIVLDRSGYWGTGVTAADVSAGDLTNPPELKP